MAAKKIVQIKDDVEETIKVQEETIKNSTTGTFEISPSNKAEAKKMRLIAGGAWLIAFVLEIGAILVLRKVPVSMFWLLTLIVLDLAFAVTGSYFWKKANNLDPASESDKVRYLIQNQLGVIISLIVFLPLVILIFTNKNLSSKQKGIAGSVGVVALLIAGYFGIDFDPNSIEKLQEKDKTNQTTEEKNTKDPEENVTKADVNENNVYWTEHGKSYHLYSDCSYINGVKTDEIFNGTPVQAKELKNITDICDRCQRQFDEEKN